MPARRSLPRRLAGLVAVLLAGVVGACGDAGAEAPADGGPDVADPRALTRLPTFVPAPPDGVDNPLTPEKAALGRHLFYDRRLSVDGTIACDSCHQQERAFADERAFAEGATGETTARHPMGLTNVAYASTLTWASPTLTTLERQVLVPLFGEAPVEHGLTGHEDDVLARLAADATYQRLFPAAFPDDPEPIRLGNVTKALAAFERTLLSFDSPYDRWLHGDDDAALSPEAQRGMEIFFGEAAECFHCHGGFNFSDAVDHAGKTIAEKPFHNTGLYNVDGSGAYPRRDQGLITVTGDAEDMGRFKAPTLRNIAVTAPYMHDGSIPSLEEAVAHYAAGGAALDDDGDPTGMPNPGRSAFVRGFVLDDGETAALVAFLESLTDESFLTDPQLANPWPAGSPAR